MRRPFAMWIENASAMQIRGPQVLLTGTPLGPAPEIRDALCIYAPFSAPLRVRCTSVLSQSGGAAGARFTFGIDATDFPLAARQCMGAVIVEEGVLVHAFTARLRERAAAPCYSPARFDLHKDRAFGLVNVRGHMLNIMVVGGGLANEDAFWPSLERITPQDMPPLDVSALERVSVPFWPGTGIWQLPTIRVYPRGEWESALVLGPAGPVTREGATLYVDDAWRKTSLYQQPDGLTQLFVDIRPDVGANVVIAPFSVAA